MKRQWTLVLVGAALGAMGGWLYWSNIGCSSGGCAIMSHPLNSTLYGAFVGGLLGGSFHGRVTEKTPNEQQQ